MVAYDEVLPRMCHYELSELPLYSVLHQRMLLIKVCGDSPLGVRIIIVIPPNLQHSTAHVTVELVNLGRDAAVWKKLHRGRQKRNGY